MTTDPTHDPELAHNDAGPGALLLPTAPTPPPSTIRILIPHGCAWTTRDVQGATQVDVTLTPPPRSRRQANRR
jgi:hypothetical protein